MAAAASASTLVGQCCALSATLYTHTGCASLQPQGCAVRRGILYFVASQRSVVTKNIQCTDSLQVATAGLCDLVAFIVCMYDQITTVLYAHQLYLPVWAVLF